MTRILKIPLTIVFLFLLVLIVPNPSFAQPPEQGNRGAPKLQAQICKIRTKIFCRIGTPLVAFAIIFMGILALLGKLNWPLVVISAAGVIIYFSAERTVRSVSGKRDAISAACECR